MACHTPLLKEVKKQREIPLPSLGPIPLINVEFRDTHTHTHTLSLSHTHAHTYTHTYMHTQYLHTLIKTVRLWLQEQEVLSRSNFQCILLTDFKIPCDSYLCTCTVTVC